MGARSGGRLGPAIAGAWGDLAYVALTSSMRFIEFDVATWSNNTVIARNISPATLDLGSAALSVQVTKRRIALPHASDE